MTEIDVDAVVIGAGVSGLVSTSVLLEQGARSVAVLDTYPAAGGNHLDLGMGGYTFDIGSLIFQDDSPLVRRFPELLPQYVPVDPAWSRITPQGVVSAYPFSVRSDIVAAGPWEWLRIAGSLAVSRIRFRRQRNARDFAYYWIGAHLARRSGLEHYMERFCGRPADEIELSFAHSRMMWIAEYARVSAVLRALRRRPGDAVRTNQQLVRPREGFAALYRPAVETLEQGGAQFHLDVALRAIERDGDDFVVTAGDDRFRTRRVVSTIPIDAALRLVGEDTMHLPTVTLITLCYSFAGERGFADPILYNFSADAPWKRLTVHSDFYGKHDGRQYFAVEVVASPECDDAATADAWFRRHVVGLGLFQGDLRLEGDARLDEVYPVFVHGARARADAAIAKLRAFGLTSLGKQGGFDYQPTARVSTERAERVLASDPLKGAVPR